MKKQLLAALLASFGASALAAGSSSSLEVHFVGTVVETPCVVDVGAGSNRVYLGQIKNNGKGGIVNASFNISQCEGISASSTNNNVTIKFAPAQGTTLSGNALKSTSYEDVQVNLFTDPAGANPVENLDNMGLKVSLADSATNGVISMYAQLQSTGSVAKGDIDIVSTWEITYQ